ncbi:MAG: ATPase [Caldiserica bacterium]|nr:MAG: ATPase [Caldisericota bacterium]
MNFLDKFDATIRGVFPLIHIYSSEYDRVLYDIVNYFFNKTSFGFTVGIYNSAKGVKAISDGSILNSYQGEYIPGTVDIEGALRILLEKSETVFIFRNLDLYLQDYFRKPKLIDLLYTIYEVGISSRIFVINISSYPVAPELKNYFIAIDYPLPDETEIKKIIKEFLEPYENIKVDRKTLNMAINLCKGMSKAEIEGALSISLVTKKKIDLDILREEKARIVKKTGLLEWIEEVPPIDDIGGLDNLKDWFRKIAYAFKNPSKANKYGLKVPKGCLLTGIPGTGKTLSAKAIASLFEVPLFRLDVARLYGSLVGETERNVREALSLIDAMSPCVVIVDEVEKAISGIHSSSYSDSGVTSRLVGSLLYYLQEKKSHSFFVCTSNDISLLPPEFLRKGRFDEIWYVGLPNEIEREYIWKIHLKKTGRDWKDYNLNLFVSQSEGFTGAEIEAVIQETLYHCFYEDREPTDEDFLHYISKTTPLSTLEKDKIRRLEEWAKTSQIKRANLVVPARKPEKIKATKKILN